MSALPEPPATLQRRLLDRLEDDPDAPALAIYESDGSFEWLTRGELHGQAAASIASPAARSLGPGDVALIVLRGSRVTANVLLGVLRRGAVPLLMAPPLRPDPTAWQARFRHVLRKSRARFVLSQQPLLALIDPSRQRRATTFVDVADSRDRDDAPAELEPGANDSTTVAMQLTSGTTAAPRLCVWDQRGLRAALDDTAEAIALRDDDAILTWTPLYHDLGLVNNFLLSLVHGVRLVLIDPIDFVKKPAIWLQAMSRTGATITWSPNFAFALATSRISDADLTGVRLDHVRAFWNGAERVHLQTVRAFERRFRGYGVRPDCVRASYGGAENVGGATFGDPEGPLVAERIDRRILGERGIATPVAEGAPEDAALTVVSVGMPRPGIDVRITNRSGKLLPDGEVGEIALATASRMCGYLGDARATRRALRWDLLRMGDLGYRRGDEIFWLGRVGERITIRSTKLDPSDLESILLNVDGLREGVFAAFGVDDERSGTQLLVIVTEARLPPSRPLEQIGAEVKRRVFTDWGVEVGDLLVVKPGTIVKTSSGKRRHRHCRTLYLSGVLESEIVWRTARRA